MLAIVVVQRLAELAFAHRNTKRLIAEGATEAGARHYPLVVALHAAWIVAIAVFVPADSPANVPLLVAFFALQGARLWVIASLGRFWTTRIITRPGAPLVRDGPYRFFRHPNYVVVAVEIPLLPLAFGASEVALIFGLANLALLSHRIRVEDRALADRFNTSGTSRGCAPDRPSG